MGFQIITNIYILPFNIVQDKQQMEKILERVEDKEDAAALKRAQMEEIEYVTEGAAEVASMDKDDEE